MPDALTAHGLRVHRFAEPTTVLGRFVAAFGREPPALSVALGRGSMRISNNWARDAGPGTFACGRRE
jgi:hypothetical protein